MPNFSKKQWEFLATLRALGQPVHINLIGELVPLKPGPFMDLIRRAEDLGWIRQIAPDIYDMPSDIPRAVEDRFRKINSPARLSKLLKRLKQRNMVDQLTPENLNRLSHLSGQELEHAIRENDLAQEAIRSGELETALTHVESVIKRLSKENMLENSRALFVSAVLLLSKLRLRLGKGINDVPELLKKARHVAKSMGDRRSQALTDLHLGRFSYVADRLSDALTSLVSGLDEVDELGDDDIVAQSSEFVGLYYFLQGMHKDAVTYFDRAMISSDTHKEGLVNFFLPFTFGFCTAYLGQFNRAVGVLDFNRRRYQDSAPGLSSYFGSALAIVLLMMGNKQQAFARFKDAEIISRRHKNHPGLLLARIGLAHYYFLEGDFGRALKIMTKSASEAEQADYQVRNYIFPFILEHLFEFDRLGLNGLSKEYVFEKQMEKVINGPNVHLKGVAYRLRASGGLTREEAPESIQSDLDASLRYLKRSGDPTEIAKTRAKMAQLELLTGNKETAIKLAREAWVHLAKYDGVFFSDELQSLLKESKTASVGHASRSEIVNRFLDMLEELVPSADLDELLTHIVAVATRFYRAERGGLFWFRGREEKGSPALRAACNLSSEDIAAESFYPNLSLVFKSYRENLPLVIRHSDRIDHEGNTSPGAVLCLPFEVRGRVSGVLYHDNTYTDESFDFLDHDMLLRVARHMSAYIERIWDYCRLVDEKGRMYSGQSALSSQTQPDKLIGNSAEIKQLLSRADQVANSEASVLIFGETGVGKELLARRIHGRSPRAEGPLITVDLTTIPEGLVESELFGHEKGSFTGAHRQKPGRIELAHQGSLFMDEVGEIPLFTQAKLLRVLQEKTFMRIGGTRTQVSDFRLIAATNRDLKNEVSTGRFREDLFYRLNVIPLKIPPLRERGHDTILLAKHFLRRYTRKHNQPPLYLSPENEAELSGYHWPGNVRELKNVIERAVLLAVDDRLEFNLSSHSISEKDPFSDIPTMQELQRRYIKFILEKTGGRKGGVDGAAELLGMKRSTLYTRMIKLGLH